MCIAERNRARRIVYLSLRSRAKCATSNSAKHEIRRNLRKMARLSERRVNSAMEINARSLLSTVSCSFFHLPPLCRLSSSAIVMEFRRLSPSPPFSLSLSLSLSLNKTLNIIIRVNLFCRVHRLCILSRAGLSINTHQLGESCNFLHAFNDVSSDNGTRNCHYSKYSFNNG
jgi:hypothetical protein